MDRKSVGAHGSKAFREFLLHGINGRIDAYEGHDPERDNSYGDASPEFITPDRTERKRKNIAYFHLPRNTLLI